MKYFVLLISLIFVNNVAYGADCAELRSNMKFAQKQLNDWKSHQRTTNRNSQMMRKNMSAFGASYDTSMVDTHSDSVLQEREEAFSNAQMEYDYECR